MTLSEISELLSDREMITELEKLVAARAKKRASKPKGSDNLGSDDIDASVTGNRTAFMTTEVDPQFTYGGLLSPADDAERMATLAAENYYSAGGLTLPDYQPSVRERLLAEFLRPSPASTFKRNPSREVVSGLTLPE
jgi:hypothetical protein